LIPIAVDIALRVSSFGYRLRRTSLEGRFALDIMRTVLQTAVAAHAPLQEYVLSVLRASPAAVAAAPGVFTLREWAATNVQPSSRK
jgi:hypothetical protein